MSNLGNLINCRIIINDDSGNFLADTRIIKYHSISNIITVNRDAFDWRTHQRLNILIFANNSQLLEYKGTSQKSTSTVDLEIGLYQGREKEDRKYLRYRLGAAGQIKNLIIDNQNISLHTPIEVMVENISATGILIAALTNSFQEGSMFDLLIPNKGQNLSVQCVVVRNREISDNLSEYGCRFLKIFR